MGIGAGGIARLGDKGGSGSGRSVWVETEISSGAGITSTTGGGGGGASRE